MKQSVRCLGLAVITGGLGTIAAALRSLYFASALDERGFLIPCHPAQIMFWILAGIALLLTLVFTLKTPTIVRKPPMGIYTGLSQILLSLCLGLTAGKLSPDLRFYRILQILGGASALVFLADGICRCTGRKPGLLPYSLFCVFLLICSVDMYAQWSNVPELERVLVPAAAQILLIPLACEKASWDMGKNYDRRLLFFSAMAGFFCLSSMGCPGVQVLHLGGAVLSISTILSLRSSEEAV